MAKPEPQVTNLTGNPVEGDPVVTEVPESAVLAAQEDPDRLVIMAHPDLEGGISQVPFSSFESFWSKKGWKEATQEQIELGGEIAVRQGIK